MDNPLGVLFHDESHAIHIETISLWHHAFAETVSDMVRAEEGNDHDSYLQRHQTERDEIPSPKHETLEIQIELLAAWQGTARVASLADGSLDVRREITTALELVLNSETSIGTEIARPLGVDFAFKVERALLVCEIAWCY
jgi:hypothetical protein